MFYAFLNVLKNFDARRFQFHTNSWCVNFYSVREYCYCGNHYGWLSCFCARIATWASQVPNSYTFFRERKGPVGHLASENARICTPYVFFYHWCRKRLFQLQLKFINFDNCTCNYVTYIQNKKLWSHFNHW